MLKKVLLVAAATLAFGLVAKAQTNLQMFYDFGKDRQFVTTTLEGFYNDNWGNTFFFIDHDFDFKGNGGVKAPAGTYMEFARCFNFWQDVPVLGNFSLQVEYNGGIYKDYFIQSALLVGVDYFLHSANFNNTFNFKVLYKKIASTVQQVPLQFTFVWGMQDLFGLKGLRFSGFADIWGENVINFMEGLDKPRKFVFISEPQIWYNVGKFIGVPNLNIGGEVELSVNFAGYDGFYARPCIGTKWVF